MADVLSSGSNRPPRRWVSVAVVLALAAGAIVYATVRDRGSPHTTAKPSTSPTATVSPTPVVPGPPGKPTVTNLGHRMLSVTAGWELFARGISEVVRIQPARGRITVTPVPALGSGGPVSFLAGPHQAIIRPLDFVPGYVIPDGRSARPLADGYLGHGGPVLPGPDPDDVWAASTGNNPQTMRLVGFDGDPIGPSVRTPPSMDGFPRPDGGGYLLFDGLGGAYDAKPGSVHRVTTGTVVAVGPTRWLTVECDDQDRCSTVVIDRRDDTRHVLGPTSDNPRQETGIISPDGKTAALLQTNSVDLLSLTSGADRRLGLSVLDEPFGEGSLPMVWSPDSRWLFVADADGTISAVDGRTGRVHHLGVSLPPVQQVAIRAAV